MFERDWLALDRRLSQHLTGWLRSTPARVLAQLLAHSGDSLLWLAGGVFLWRYGSLGVRILSTVAVTSIVSYALKWLLRRPRPAGDAAQLYLGHDRHSFPSGHATRMGGLSVTLGALLPLPGRLLLLGWSLSVGLARVALGVHYVGDIAGGFLIGAGLGALLLRLWLS